jgi:2,4-diaminopentanoate dehydrogenase
MSYRVIQWTTGGTGRNALRHILARPDLELAGVWVHSAEKNGADAAELCGWPRPTGVHATNSVDEIVDLDADCVSYMRTNPYYPLGDQTASSEVDAVVEELDRLLSSGKNVVSLTTLPLVWPPMWGAPVLERLQRACEKGQSSFRAVGICPGFYTDALPLLLSGMSERIDRIRYVQLLNYSTYAQPTRMRMLGFGVRPSELKPQDPHRMAAVYGPAMYVMAAALGVRLSGFTEDFAWQVTREDLDVAFGRVEAGTVGAIRMELCGLVGGEPLFVFEVVSRLRNDLAPDWPSMGGREGFRVVIEGEPNLSVDCDIGAEAGNGIEITLNQTAALAINEIPGLCRAAPGVHSFLDSPVTTGRAWANSSQSVRPRSSGATADAKRPSDAPGD